MKKRTRIPEPRDIPVMILAGGRGTRLMEETQSVPKPMVTIGGKPILFHIMRYYASFGFRRFVVCLGYRGHVIKDFFLDLNRHTASLIIDGRTARPRYDRAARVDWEIALVETGEHSLTGMRVRQAARYVDADHFALTYGDGLCDVDLSAAWKYHVAHGRLGTVTAVHPPSRFGKLDLGPGGAVRAFREKEHLNHDYINGGFFFFRRGFLERIPVGENVSLESSPLTQLAADGELQAFKHEGFWQCMDTLRDRESLEQIHDSGKAPWIRW